MRASPTAGNRRPRTDPDAAAAPVAVSGLRFLAAAGRRRRALVPWGFNYDWTILDGRVARLEDLLAACPDKLAADFRAMAALGANTVRVFLSTPTFLRSATVAEGSALRSLRVLFRAAEASGVRLIVTGLALMRPGDIPGWMRRASDETLGSAELAFWDAVARRCRTEGSVFAYDLQNEPAAHWSDSRALVDGCLQSPNGETFCYVHRHYRHVSRRWTQYVQGRFGRESVLRRRWPDYPRPGESWSAIAIPAPSRRDCRYGDYLTFHGLLLSGWARRLAEVIRAADPARLITVGALDPAVMADAVDFYSLHLYPGPIAPSRRFSSVNRTAWRRQVDALPRDKPLLVEEFFPLYVPPTTAPAAVIDALFAATRDRAAGWLTSYFGPPEILRRVRPREDRRHQAAVDVYAATLAHWRRARPGVDSAKAPVTA